METITITYTYDPSVSFPFRATTEYKGEKYSCCGDSYDDAKATLTQTIRKVLRKDMMAKSPETIDVDIDKD
jgi:hypothetical protein